MGNGSQNWPHNDSVVCLMGVDTEIKKKKHRRRVSYHNNSKPHPFLMTSFNERALY